MLCISIFNLHIYFFLRPEMKENIKINEQCYRIQSRTQQGFHTCMNAFTKLNSNLRTATVVERDSRNTEQLNIKERSNKKVSLSIHSFHGPSSLLLSLILIFHSFLNRPFHCLWQTTNEIIRFQWSFDPLWMSDQKVSHFDSCAPLLKALTETWRLHNKHFIRLPLGG